MLNLLKKEGYIGRFLVVAKEWEKEGKKLIYFSVYNHGDKTKNPTKKLTYNVDKDEFYKADDFVPLIREQFLGIKEETEPTETEHHLSVGRASGQIDYNY